MSKIFKRKGSTYWYFKFTIDGKTVFHSTGTEDERKAQEIADKAKAQYWDVVRLGIKQRYLWQEAVLRYLDEAQHKRSLEDGKVIRVPLNQDAIDILIRQLGKHQHRVFTFGGKPIEKAGTDAFRKALKRAGIENFCWHGLRHAWASWHVQAGTPLNVLQELGGWSDIRMVQRYAHLSPDHLADHAARIAGVLTPELGDNVVNLKARK